MLGQLCQAMLVAAAGRYGVLHKHHQQAMEFYKRIAKDSCANKSLQFVMFEFAALRNLI